jgi:hypothetical protein
LRFTYLLSINSNIPRRVFLSDLDLRSDGQGSGYVVYESWSAGAIHTQRLPTSNGSFVVPETPQQSDYIAGYSFKTIAPVLAGGWVYLGEPEKVVKASSRRVDSITSTKGNFQARLLLARNEHTNVAILSPDNTVLEIECSSTDSADTRAHTTSAFGDVDVPMALECTAGGVGGGARCDCK